ncbi:hypothetical protein VSDG_02971 [Cytospora chrysosperma]|uniref:Uncharacterized protein n=1 Tax=Cytospora chrysosperma TaxID=252740 RepID=A0A423W8Z9_CYTCH|nr:hypothetical protein VSDG_02971 [Valsa sordida]
MVCYITILVAALIMPALATASCHLKNQLSDSDPPPKLKPELCVSQGEGSWTFAMDVHEIDVPTFNSGSPWTGLVSGNSFIIYDNDCTAKGGYSPAAEGNDCGIPFVIDEDFLPYVLTIKEINTDVGDPRFKFAYANGQYSIGENGCACKDVSHDLEAEQACKCAFPLEGEPS